MVVLALLNGCATMGKYWWPEDKRVHHFQRTVDVRVSSYPEGADVTVNGKKVPAGTPVTVPITYDVERTYSHRPLTGYYLGCGAEVLAITLLAISSKPGGYAGSVAAGLFSDCVYWQFAPHALRNPRRVTERITPRRVQIRASWRDALPIRMRVVVPETRDIVLVRPEAKSFDQALLTWAGQSDKTLDSETLYRLTRQELTLYQATKLPSQAAAAKDYFERFAAAAGTDPRTASLRAEVEAAGVEP